MSIGRYLELQAPRHISTNLAMSSHSMPRASAMERNCCRVVGRSLPASTADHSAASMPASWAVSSTERPALSRAPCIKRPNNRLQGPRTRSSLAWRGINVILIYSLLLTKRTCQDDGSPDLNYGSSIYSADMPTKGIPWRLAFQRARRFPTAPSVSLLPARHADPDPLVDGQGTGLLLVLGPDPALRHHAHRRQRVRRNVRGQDLRRRAAQRSLRHLGRRRGDGDERELRGALGRAHGGSALAVPAD